MNNRLRMAAASCALSAMVAGCGKPEMGGQQAGDTAIARSAPAPFDRAAAEAEIRQGDQEFFNAVKGKDAEAIANSYTRDAISNPPNSPPLRGHDEILKYNQEFLKLPKLTMTGETGTIGFSDDGTLAYNTGKYTATFADARGRTIKDEGKYLNVLRKEGGKWKVVVDAFSSNLPPPK
jgi:uncharacterized protein (TIGR02246 family)